MPPLTCVVQRIALPAVILHGGAGAYLRTTSPERRRERGELMTSIARASHATLFSSGARAAVLDAIERMERDPHFNAGFGSKLQQDGQVRVSAALMDGLHTRLSSVYNVRDCLYPSKLADALQSHGDRNLDGEGARALMRDLNMPLRDLRSDTALDRWRELIAAGDTADAEAAIGDADGGRDLARAREASLPVPEDLQALHTLPDEDNRYGTVGACAVDFDGQIWACTSTGGRGHEAVGRVSDTPTPAGNYACPKVAISATGFGEQILDLNLCGRIATRVLDGMGLRAALERTFDEVAALDGLVGVIAITADGEVGYAHSTEACGVVWIDCDGMVHVDAHGRP